VGGEGVQPPNPSGYATTLDILSAEYSFIRCHENVRFVCVVDVHSVCDCYSKFIYFLDRRFISFETTVGNVLCARELNVLEHLVVRKKTARTHHVH